MPIMRPFQATSVGRTTSMNSEWIVFDPAFQLLTAREVRTAHNNYPPRRQSAP
jgi:hypothetical protein